jgi:hypothetical protein
MLNALQAIDPDACAAPMAMGAAAVAYAAASDSNRATIGGGNGVEGSVAEAAPTRKGSIFGNLVRNLRRR